MDLGHPRCCRIANPDLDPVPEFAMGQTLNWRPSAQVHWIMLRPEWYGPPAIRGTALLFLFLLALERLLAFETP
jgi:hypothetical protein